MSSAVAPDASFETLVNFKKKSALQRSAMLAMSMSMTPSELKALGSSFRDMDTDNDGVITFDEFKAHLEKYDTKTNAKEAFVSVAVIVCQCVVLGAWCLMLSVLVVVLLILKKYYFLS